MRVLGNMPPGSSNEGAHVGRARVLSAFSHPVMHPQLAQLPGGRRYRLQAPRDSSLADLPASGVQVLVCGLAVQRWEASGRSVLELLGPGDLIRADLPGATITPPSGAALLPLVGAEVWAAPADDVSALIASCPQVTMDLASRLARRTRRADEVRMLRTHLPGSKVTARVAWFLLVMHELVGSTTVLNGHKAEGLAHAQLGALIGALRESVSRSLARLAREGALRLDGHGITIVDVEALRLCAGRALCIAPLPPPAPAQPASGGSPRMSHEFDGDRGGPADAIESAPAGPDKHDRFGQLHQRDVRRVIGVGH